MIEKQRLEIVAKRIVDWYQKNKRDLPWRESKDPYSIWISEVMLQQTRIEAVKEYYKRFMDQIPNIESLAQIEEEKLLKIWEGLGYYSRARNLKKAAEKIMNQYNGQMPKTYQELQDLPGIGEYTAGAISSIAYNEAVPAVDGNVLRVISRVLASQEDILLAKTKKKVTGVLCEIMPKEAGDFNEGIMELGETICVPNGEPLCQECPLQTLCLANQEGETNVIPVRVKKTKRRIEERTVFIFIYQEKIAIRKRGKTGLLANLYEFPNIEGKLEEKELKQWLDSWKLKAKSVEKLGKTKHIFSHIEWHMIGYQIHVEKKNKEFLWVSKEEIKHDYAIPGAFEFYKSKLTY